MGYYLEPPTAKGKAGWLINNAGAVVVDGSEWPPTDDQKVLVCVVENPAFDAAGVAFDKREYDRFVFDAINPEARVRTWLLVDREYAVKLCGQSDLDEALTKGLVP